MSQSRQSNEYRALSLRSSTLADLAASVNQTVEALLRSEVAQAKAAGKSCIEAFQQSESGLPNLFLEAPLLSKQVKVVFLPSGKVATMKRGPCLRPSAYSSAARGKSSMRH